MENLKLIWEISTYIRILTFFIHSSSDKNLIDFMNILKLTKNFSQLHITKLAPP